MAQNEDRINTSDAQHGDVLVTITYPQGGGGSARATLRVEDRMSSQTLVQVDMTPEQFMRTIASGTVSVSGARLPARPERIGRRMQNTSTNINSHAESATAEAERVRDAYLADGWEEVSIDRTNFGRRVRAYRWIADEEEVADLSAERLDIVACEENLDIYARRGDARPCRDIGLALARELTGVREELDRRDAVHGADEAAMLRTAAELRPLRELAEWLVSLEELLPEVTTTAAETRLAEATIRARVALGRTEEG